MEMIIFSSVALLTAGAIVLVWRKLAQRQKWGRLFAISTGGFFALCGGLIGGSQAVMALVPEHQVQAKANLTGKTALPAGYKIESIGPAARPEWPALNQAAQLLLAAAHKLPTEYEHAQAMLVQAKHFEKLPKEHPLSICVYVGLSAANVWLSARKPEAALDATDAASILAYRVAEKACADAIQNARADILVTGPGNAQRPAPGCNQASGSNAQVSRWSCDPAQLEIPQA